MSVFPIVIDSRPQYLNGAGDGIASLGLLPYGNGTLLSYLSDQLFAATRRRPVVLRGFDSTPEYESAIRTQGAAPGPSVASSEFGARIGSYEPSDWLLFVDPRCFPSEGFDPSLLFGSLDDMPPMVRNLVALASNAGGTSERVELDAEGRVRRVQRYYDSVTSTMTAGMVASLVPVSSLGNALSVPFSRLADLRRELVINGAPARDVPMRGAALDLAEERMLLRLNEVAAHKWAQRQSESGPDAAAPSSSSQVAASARLVGDVVVQDGVIIESEATVVGPAVIGAGSRIGRGAIIVQSVVAAGSVVPPGAIIRQRLFGNGTAAVEGSRIGPAETAVDALSSALPSLEEEAQPRRLYPTVKAFAEAVLAALALIVLLPLLLLIAAIIKLESSGPVLYGDPREAKDGKPFRCFKFRTMFVGAEAAQRDLMGANELDGPQFKMDRDPRVTRIGRWLRAVSLDELPQLINVALGQMSLVGPRPSPFRENQTCVPWREARLSVRPGITGLWQVCRHERQHGDFHQWIYYDMQYVLHMSFWVDVKILVATVVTLGGKGHVPLSWIIRSHTTEGL
jgi:lipopolysaccharide/colanic/teichoic acid biosynthesis glycosyltransferase